MNHTRALPLLFLLGSTALSQTPGKQFSSQALQGNCPVEIKASFNRAGKIVPVAPDVKGRSTSDEPRLQIALSNPKTGIAAARVTVHGFPVGGRVEPAVLYLPNDPAEITKTIAFDQTVEVGQSSSFDVALPNFSTVTSIDLDSVTYTDGSTWHPEKRKYCRAVGLPIDASTDALSR